MVSRFTLNGQEQFRRYVTAPWHHGRNSDASVCCKSVGCVRRMDEGWACTDIIVLMPSRAHGMVARRLAGPIRTRTGRERARPSR